MPQSGMTEGLTLPRRRGREKGRREFRSRAVCGPVSAPARKPHRGKAGLLPSLPFRRDKSPPADLLRSPATSPFRGGFSCIPQP